MICFNVTFTSLLDCFLFSGQHFSLRHLGMYEPPPPQRGLTFCSDLGVSHRGFSVGTVQDLDDDGPAAMSPEHGGRLWCRGDLGKSSERSSCLSSRSNSVLTLTDTEHENKSDSENGRRPPRPPALPGSSRAFQPFQALTFMVSLRFSRAWPSLSAWCTAHFNKMIRLINL